MFLAGSRFVSQWLNVLGIRISTISAQDIYMEGSPIDMPVFLSLIVASLVVLFRRRLNWREVFTNNYIMCAFYIFALTSTLWSDYPFISLKRWFKTLGAISMVLVILTEANPYAAFGVIMRRLAFVLLPLSVLFIKYFPAIGRQFHSVGTQMFVGATTQKNQLGQLCLLLGVYFFWNLFYVDEKRTDLGRRLRSFMYVIVLAMIAWLLYMSNSATSLVCLAAAILLFLVGQTPLMKRRPERIITFFAVCIVLYVILQLSFDANTFLITMLGRRPDLTTRVPMWEELLSMAANPYWGFGWQSFWLGRRGEIMAERWAVHSTHNGYLDLYLNLGIIGLVLLFGWVLFGLVKVTRHLALEQQTGLLCFVFILIVCLYNWTETIDFGVSNMYLLFLFGTIRMPTAVDDVDDTYGPSDHVPQL